MTQAETFVWLSPPAGHKALSKALPVNNKYTLNNRPPGHPEDKAHVMLRRARDIKA